MEILLQLDSGWTQDASVVDAGLVSTWGKLKAELTRAQPTVPTTIEKVLGLSRETSVSSDALQRRLTTVEEEVVRSVAERKTLEAELRDAKLQLE